MIHRPGELWILNPQKILDLGRIKVRYQNLIVNGVIRPVGGFEKFYIIV